MAHRIGAHVSIAGGHHKAVERVKAIGGNCLQIFSASPRGWKEADVSDEEAERFKEACESADVTPVYFHALYLINLARSDEGGEKSVKALTAELNVASKMGVNGSVVHVGSFGKGDSYEKEYESVIANIKKVLDNTPRRTHFLIENAGMRKIGRTLDEIGDIIRDVGSERVAVCLDTCHLHAAGYDLTTQKKLDAFLDEFDEKIGLERLEVLHFNDSKDEFGSLRDRHENIGEGNVGDDVFKLLLNGKRTKDLPVFLETPGFDDNGPDAENVDRLWKMVK